MDALLAVEARLDGAEEADSPAHSPQKLPSAVVDSLEFPADDDGPGEVGFHASKKSNTLKKYYKKLFKKPKDKEKHHNGDGDNICSPGRGAGTSPPPLAPGQQAQRAAPPQRAGPWEQQQQQQQQQVEHQQDQQQLAAVATAGASDGGHEAGEEGDEVTSAALPSYAAPGPSGSGAASSGPFSAPGARYAPGRAEGTGGGRHEYGGDDGASSVSGMDSRMSTYSSGTAGMSGTIKGFLGPRKKRNKQYELDALRMEMEMLQERCSAAENNLSSASHDVNALRADRDALQQQLRERTADLTEARAAAAKAEEEVARLKTLHSQVKGALQGAYSQNQDLSKQIADLESLCSAQQASLEEGEERFRGLSDAHDALRHAGLQAKAQLVTAQAQVSELRAAREELGERVAALERQAAGLRAELEARAQSARELASSKVQLEGAMEGMLGRLRELEGEKTQLEARQILLQEENLDLGRQAEALRDEGREAEARLSRMQGENAELLCQLERALSRGEALAADKQRSQAERDGLAAELRSSADLRETLKARNDELAAELGSIREAAAAKKGSPLRWRRPAKASTPAPTADGDADARDGGASSPDFGPMTKQRALFGSGKGSAGPAALAARGAQQHPTAAPGLALAVRGAPISSQHSSDVTAHVTAGALQGAAAPALGLDESCLATAPGHPPAPLCSRSPELSGPKGPLAAGRAGAGGRKLGGAAVGGSPRAGEGQGFLGGLFGCFSPPPAMHPVAAA